MSSNPFKPTAGKMPPILIGRQDIVDDFSYALENGAGAPGRLMLITGQRGFGKTVMLTELRRTAQSFGWETFSETASQGMTQRLITALSSKKRQVAEATFAPSVSVAGIASVSLGSVAVVSPDATLNLREAINQRLKKLSDGKGILFTVDETQAAQTEELVALATAIQHVIADEDLRQLPDDKAHGIAFAFAGLPAIVDDVVNNEVLTFLRRAMYYELEAIPLPDVRNAYIESVISSKKTLSTDCAERAAQASEGNPYLVQLIGYYMWQAAQARHSKEISEQDVEQGIRDAQSQFPMAVCVPAFKGLTSAQQHFLQAMAPDYPMPSSLSDIAERAGKSMSWVGKYRTSLERAQMIHTSAWGMVAYSIPYFGKWIQQI